MRWKVRSWVDNAITELNGTKSKKKRFINTFLGTAILLLTSIALAV